MTDEESVEVVDLLDSGVVLAVPFTTPLFAGAEAMRSHLRRTGPDAYVLCTYFREHAPGHGFSLEQTEEVALTQGHLRERLRFVERGACHTVSANAAMTQAQLDEVWSMLDRDVLAGLARKGPEPVFATISGAHLYGFASPDSDVDLRGAFLRPAREVLGLFPPDETITIEDKTVLDLDWVAHDVRKFARMMTQHNGYALEQLYSPLIVVSTPAHEELLALGRGCVTRPIVRHYQGFGRGRRKRLLEPEPTVKHLLYAYRAFLTGIHLMRAGEVVAHIANLVERFPMPELDELIERKRTGAEKMLLDARDLARHAPLLDALELQLEDAHDRSSLPDEPTTVSALDDLVVRLRLASERSRPM
jgi:hypothetical protein